MPFYSIVAVYSGGTALTMGPAIFWAYVAIFVSIVIGEPVRVVRGLFVIIGYVSGTWIVLYVHDLGFQLLDFLEQACEVCWIWLL